MESWSNFLWLFGGMAILFKGGPIYFFFYILLFLSYLLQAWVRRAFAQLVWSRKSPSDAIFLGEKTHVEITVENRGRLPLPWLEVQETLPKRLAGRSSHRRVVALAPGEKVTIRYELTGAARGCYPLGPLGLRSSDPLGLYPEVEVYKEEGQITVFPKILPLESLGIPTRQPLGAIKQNRRIFEDPSKIQETREYTPGDPFNRIHWKATAATSRIQVKEYEATISLDTVVFLNLGEKEYQYHSLDYQSELAITTAASVISYLDSRGQSVGLVTNGHQPGSEEPWVQITAKKGRNQARRILEVLARIQTRPALPFGEMIAQSQKSLPWGSTLVFITPRDTDELVAQALQLRSAGYLIAILVTGPARYASAPPGGLMIREVREEESLYALSE